MPWTKADKRVAAAVRVKCNSCPLLLAMNGQSGACHQACMLMFDSVILCEKSALIIRGLLVTSCFKLIRYLVQQTTSP